MNSRCIFVVIALLILSNNIRAEEQGKIIFNVENWMPYDVWLKIERSYVCTSGNEQMDSPWFVNTPQQPIKGHGGVVSFSGGKYKICSNAGLANLAIQSITVYWKDASGKEHSLVNTAQDILKRANRVGKKMRGAWNFQIGRYNGQGQQGGNVHNGVVYTWWDWPGDAVVDCSNDEGCL